MRSLSRNRAVTARMNGETHKVFAARQLGLGLRLRRFGDVSLVGVGGTVSFVGVRGVRNSLRGRLGHEGTKRCSEVHDFGSPTHSHPPQVSQNLLSGDVRVKDVAIRR
jgi:hypothetical protein